MHDSDNMGRGQSKAMAPKFFYKSIDWDNLFTVKVSGEIHTHIKNPSSLSPYFDSLGSDRGAMTQTGVRFRGARGSHNKLELESKPRLPVN